MKNRDQNHETRPEVPWRLFFPLGFGLFVVLYVSFCLPTSLQFAAEELQEELKDFPDATLTRPQWNKRVEEARQNSEQFVAGARTRTYDPVQSDEEISKEKDERAMSDSSLRSGDIVSTSRGFLMYVGRDDHEPQPNDFVPAPESAVPAVSSPIAR